MTDLELERRAPDASPSGALTIDLVHSEEQARAAVAVLAEVWPRPDGVEPLPAELAWVFAHSGNYVSIARVDGAPVGAAIGFRGHDDEGPHLHSHIAGVLPRCQGANVGYALKQHQRTWALAQGLDRITWTFDPLVARNAYFNVVKLGARLVRYYVDFYGPMDDGINAGDETDRCLVSWRLTSTPATEAAAGRFTTVDPAAALDAGGSLVLSVGDDQQPVRGAGDGSVRLVQLPTDIVQLRHDRPQLARQWRLALRESLRDAFDAGLAVTGVARDCTYVVGPATASA